MRKNQKVYVFSRDQAIKFETRNNSAIIRVLEPEEKYYSVAGNYRIQHTERFHDVIPNPLMPSNIVYFDSKMADDLLDTFNSIKDFDKIVFHCHAGISRSPAIALAYAWFIGSDDLEEEIKSKGIVPNPLVMAIMAKKLGVWDKKKDYILRFAPDEKGERLLESI